MVKKNDTRRYCTVPAIFGLRKWFEKRFGCDCCKEHDEYYIKIWRAWRRNLKPRVSRLQADNIFFKCMISKGRIYYPIAIFSWVHLRVNYWSYTILKKVFEGLFAGLKEAYLAIKFMIRG